MNTIFVGMIFTLFNINIKLSGSSIGLLPDFVGYILIIRGLDKLAEQSTQFAKARPWAVGMAVYTGVTYGLALLGIVQSGIVQFILGALAQAAALTLTYWIVAGVREIETARVRDLLGQRLKSLWLYHAVVSGIAYGFGAIPVIGAIAAVAAMITGILFLAAFYQSKKQFEQME